MKDILVSTVSAAVVVVLAFTFFAPKPTIIQQMLGSGSGQNSGAHQFFDVGLTAGGRMATTSTATTYTTMTRDFQNTPTVISWLPNINTTVSISGTSTLPYIPNVGDTVDIYFRNASTTAAATVTFAAADGGLDIQIAEATGGDLVLNGGDWEKLTFIHTSQYVVTAIVDEMKQGD